METVRSAVVALERTRFARDVSQEFAELRRDPEAWAAYLREIETTDVRDGVD